MRWGCQAQASSCLAGTQAPSYSFPHLPPPANGRAVAYHVPVNWSLTTPSWGAEQQVWFMLLSDLPGAMPLLVARATAATISHNCTPPSPSAAAECLLCFSLVMHALFANLSARWLPELWHHCPATPVLLVSTQANLCHDACILALAHHCQQPMPATAARALAAQPLTQPKAQPATHLRTLSKAWWRKYDCLRP
ncbi:UNVERIFIED_CONTAM: hypothetical protein K2H54_038945 [Gekko kuhli]